MQSGAEKYRVGMQGFAYKPSHSWTEFISPKIVRSALQLDLFTNYRSYVKKYFSNPKLIALMEFPVIFLGASPKKIPALYSLMNYGGYVLGTKYPMGGFYRLVTAMKSVAEKYGARFYFDHTVEKLMIENSRVTSLVVNGKTRSFDAVIASSDYHHSESLLEKRYRNYDEQYWTKKIFAPSCLIYYLGFKEKLPNLQHHSLFFENELDLHIADIYEHKRWPQKPLFYACCPSKTDRTVAPEGHENIFLLMPLATGVEDNEATREKYLATLLGRLEKHTGTEGLVSKIDFKRSYCLRNFIEDYNAYGGNAYGLANTFSQTAILRPSVRNKKISNLFYTGQLTVPGPGIPPAIISGKIASNELKNLE
jgi:phytoene desaturase